MAGCSGGGGSTSSTSSVPVSGTVSAPGGQIAFNQSGSFMDKLARLFIAPAHAALSGTLPVGAGTTVSLIEIDGNGNQVGAALAIATTDAAGAYTLAAPEGFIPSARYVVRATGSGTGNQLDAIVTSTAVDVDPGSSVAKNLVVAAVAGGNIANVTVASVDEVRSTVEELASEAAAYTTTAGALTALRDQMQVDEEASNIVSSLVAAGLITGTVTDSNNAPLANVTIAVRDFGNGILRSLSRTDASGAYSVRAPAGDYIVGAINMTAASTAASEWWTSGGGSINVFSAEQTTVAGTGSVTRNFVLEPGVRIGGTVTSEATGLPLQGILVQVRDFTNDQPVTAARTGADGKFRLNLRPGTYTVGAYNYTRQAYASELYNPTQNGGTSASEATPVTVVAGTPRTLDFSLLAGNKIEGEVTDPGSTPAIVPGIAVRTYNATDRFVSGVRSNKLGRYRIWLRPAVYTVRARGQMLSNDISTASITNANFAAAVGRVTATLKGPGNAALSQAKVFVFNSAGDMQGFETSNADGTVTLFTTLASIKAEVRIDNGAAIGSGFYAAAGPVTQFPSGDAIAVNVGGAATALGNVTMGAGVVISGTVTVSGVPQGGYRVQLRSGGSQFTATATQSDGSYAISVPAGTYAVRACAAGVLPGACPAFAAQTFAANTTRNFAF
jgi:hypothetical protein